uniref:Uncharacterized protein n=1 Tax=Palpitomonas bilix TaxID=652834 RepID=A0A7S3DJR5_9EUKA
MEAEQRRGSGRKRRREEAERGERSDCVHPSPIRRARVGDDEEDGEWESRASRSRQREGSYRRQRGGQNEKRREDEYLFTPVAITPHHLAHPDCVEERGRGEGEGVSSQALSLVHTVQEGRGAFACIAGLDWGGTESFVVCMTRKKMVNSAGVHHPSALSQAIDMQRQSGRGSGEPAGGGVRQASIERRHEEGDGVRLLVVSAGSLLPASDNCIDGIGEGEGLSSVLSRKGKLVAYAKGVLKKVCPVFYHTVVIAKQDSIMLCSPSHAPVSLQLSLPRVPSSITLADFDPPSTSSPARPSRRVRREVGEQPGETGEEGEGGVGNVVTFDTVILPRFHPYMSAESYVLAATPTGIFCVRIRDMRDLHLAWPGK